MNAKKIRKSVRYANFHITNAATKYTLHVNGFTGTIADQFRYNNRQKFGTCDSDNDSGPSFNCESRYFGGWWFNSCFYGHLNGKYYSGGKMTISSYNNVVLTDSGIYWKSNGFNGNFDSLIFTEMKVRRKL